MARPRKNPNDPKWQEPPERAPEPIDSTDEETPLGKAISRRLKIREAQDWRLRERRRLMGQTDA
jgi:hypothetical protein